MWCFQGLQLASASKCFSHFYWRLGETNQSVELTIVSFGKILVYLANEQLDSLQLEISAATNRGVTGTDQQHLQALTNK